MPTDIHLYEISIPRGGKGRDDLEQVWKAGTPVFASRVTSFVVASSL